DLQAARAAVRLPVLRKDFVIDPYQLLEARVAGADAVLLIAAALDDGTLEALERLARELELEALVEVHDREEMERASRLQPDLIGINNRDLKTLRVDLETTRRLLPLRPEERTLVVSESGFSRREELEEMRKWGVDAFLIGQSLMRASDPGEALRALTGGPREPLRVKVCGITSFEDARAALDAGAWALGFVFYPRSPRAVDAERARSILERLPRGTLGVGLFVDAPLEEVNRTVEQAGLRGVQL